MFYVAGDKIYLMEFDKTSEVYPEVTIVNGRPVISDTGVTKRPPVRELCSLDEIVARFGCNHPAIKPRTERPKNK